MIQYLLLRNMVDIRKERTRSNAFIYAKNGLIPDQKENRCSIQALFIMQLGCRLIPPPRTRALPRGRLILWVRVWHKSIIYNAMGCRFGYVPFVPLGMWLNNALIVHMGI